MEWITYAVMVFAVLGLFGVGVALVILRERDHDRFAMERAAWWVERKELNNRIMAKDWTSYLAIVAQESENIAHMAEQEAHIDEKTTEYDKAWAS